jgi:hypothetical protein
MSKENSMSKHTPGPWRTIVGERNLYHAHERRLILSTMDDGSVATLAKLPESYGGDYYTAEAHARLMAAAPAMLEALKIANAAINPSGREGISLHAWNHLLREATPVICSAIAKAEGRTP